MAQNYTVSITDSNACPVSKALIVGQTPGPTAIAGNDATINKGASAALSASGGNSYSWSPAYGLNCSTCSVTAASPTVTTLYCVVLTDVSGCTAKTCVRISILDETTCPSNNSFIVPNAFSPNNDGLNDVYQITGMKNCIGDFRIVIYDRWGEKVYESNDLTKGWNGTYRGKELNEGVFVYFISGTMKNGELLSKKGNITLVR